MDASPYLSKHFKWRRLPDLPTPRYDATAHTLGKMLIVVGGMTPATAGEILSPEILGLFPDDKAWTSLGTLPVPSANAGAAATKGAVVIAGGTGPDGPLKSAWTITVANRTATVTPLPELPIAIARPQLVVLDDRIYVIGAGEDGVLHAYHRPTANDAAAWERMENVPATPVPVDRLSAGLQNGGIYVFGDAGPESFAFQFSTKTGWKAVSTWPGGFNTNAIQPFGQAHLLAFAPDPDRTAPSIIAAYHAFTDTWARLDPVMFLQREAATAVWNGDLVVAGGRDVTGTPFAAAWAGKAIHDHATFRAIDYAVLVGYFALLIAMGAYFSRREKSTEAFFLGGRRVPWWAVGISIFGTSLSAITYLSIPATAFATNWVMLLSNLAITLIAPFVVFYYIPRYRASKFNTAYEFLEHRFNFPVRLYGSCIFFCFQIARIGIILYLPAIALSTATGFNIYACVLLMGVITTFYTVLGGIEAVIWTDVLQALVLIVAALLSIALIIMNIEGGISVAFTAAWNADKFHTFNWTLDPAESAAWAILIGNMFLQLYPRTADQTMVQRYFTTATDSGAKRAVWTDAILTIPVSLLFFGLGTALWMYYRQHPELLDPSLRNDGILPLFAAQHFPPGLVGLLIAGVFAASMSSLDSSINSMSSVIVNDYYKRLNPKASEENSLRLARALTIVLGLFGTGVSLYVVSTNITSLFTAWINVIGLITGGLSGIFALGVFTKRAHGAGALCGIVASAITVYFVWRYASVSPVVDSAIQAAAGFIAAFAVGYLASLAVPATRPSVNA